MPTIHKGHRARLRRRVETEGLAGFQPHEVLEYLLFSVIPQRDVNPLAHELIAQFGSVSEVLRADARALMQVPGMGEKSAQWLTLLNQTLTDYLSLDMRDRLRFDRLKLVATHCEHIFPPTQQDEMWLFNLNLSGYLLHRDMVACGRDMLALPFRRAVEPTLRYHAMSVVLLYRRVEGARSFTDAEIDFARRLSQHLQSFGVQLLDCVLYIDKRLFSMRRTGMLELRLQPVRLREEDERRLYTDWLE